MANAITTKSSKSLPKDYIFAVGRRRESVARVRLHPSVKEGLMMDTLEVKKGDMVVNGKPASQYFSGEVNKVLLSSPFKITNTENKYTVTIRVQGGGNHGQLEASIQGISNALSKANTEKYRTLLKKEGLLTRDPRARQRRKVGTGGKSRRKKQSPKR